MPAVHRRLRLHQRRPGARRCCVAPITFTVTIVLLEREMHETARVVIGCPRSTPTRVLMAEAGLAPVTERRTALAAHLLAKTRALPAGGDPLRKVAESQAPARLSTLTGWRGVGEEPLGLADICAPIEPILLLPDPPREPSPTVSFGLDIGQRRYSLAAGTTIANRTKYGAIAAIVRRQQLRSRNSTTRMLLFTCYSSCVRFCF